MRTTFCWKSWWKNLDKLTPFLTEETSFCLDPAFGTLSLRSTQPTGGRIQGRGCDYLEQGFYC